MSTARSPRPIRRLAYVGDYRPPNSTVAYIASSFEQLGIEVKRLQEEEWDAAGVLLECSDCDLFLYTKSRGIQGDVPLLLRSLQVPSASWHLDLFAGIPAREKLIGNCPFWRTLQVFTPDGGHEALFAARSVRHHWLSPGVYGRECYLARPAAEFECDVAFVGSRAYHSEWPYRAALLDWLAETYGSRFRHFGPETGPVYGDRLNRVCASARVIVGDSFYSPRYWSDRLPELLGRGAFLIFPFVEGIEEEYIPGEHFVTYHYGDLRGLRTKIDYYLAHEGERERIRRAGHEWVKAHHTYIEKCRRVLHCIDTEARLAAGGRA